MHANRLKHLFRSGLAACLLATLATGCRTNNEDQTTRFAWLAASMLRTAQPQGTAQVSMAIANSSLNVTRISVTVSGPGIPTPMEQDLVKVGLNWQGVISNIPAGNNRRFRGKAYDTAGTLIYQGQTARVAITSNQVTSVFILLQDLIPAVPFENTVPVIDSFVASTNLVFQSGTVDFTVTAHDPNPDDTLTYAWSATGGSFDNANSATTVWSAPTTTGSYTITVTVTDNKGSSCMRSFIVNVQASTGSGSITVEFNTWPVVESIIASECCALPGESVNLTLAASDSDGDNLSYLWSSSCGTFDNDFAQNPIFTMSATAVEECTVTVNLDDGRGGVNSGSLTMDVKTPVVVTPCTDTSTLVAGGTITDVCSSVAFTSGADSTVNGYVTAVAAVTLGANSLVTGDVTAGADYTSGDGSIVNGNVSAVGDVVLGANSKILGSVHSGTGVITYGLGATVGSVL